MNKYVPEVMIYVHIDLLIFIMLLLVYLILIDMDSFTILLSIFPCDFFLIGFSEV